MDEGTRTQLHLLATFHYVLAGLAAVFSLIPVLHIRTGIAVITGSLDRGGASPPLAAPGWLFVLVSAATVLMGLAYAVLLIVAARFLVRARGRTTCIVVAAISCVLFPFGTALGVLTIILLAKPGVKAGFQRDASPLPAAPAGT
jgi:hypothetical protein